MKVGVEDFFVTGHHSYNLRLHWQRKIEGYHAQLRKVTKTKRVFDGDMAVLKLLFLVQQRIANEK